MYFLSQIAIQSNYLIKKVFPSINKMKIRIENPSETNLNS
jgi:hypothetical protein